MTKGDGGQAGNLWKNPDHGSQRMESRGRSAVLQRFYRVVEADGAAGENLGAEAPPVSQARQDFRAAQARQMSAGLAEPDSAQRHLADLELPAHEVIQRHLARDDVSPALPGIKIGPVVALQGFNRLNLDQRHFPVRARLLRKGP